MEWNNRPFEKDTPVRTFGSGSELATWDAENCDRCIKHEECELCDAITAAYLGDRADPLVGRQANRLPIRPALFDRHTRQDLPRAPDRGATRFPILTLKKR